MKVMSLRRRQQLVRLARQYDALIITDDVYDLLQWSSTPGAVLARPDRALVSRLVDVDRYLDGGPADEWGNAVSNGSFSKLVGPGVRTGWAESTPRFAYGLSQVYVTSWLNFAALSRGYNRASR
jgi:DNA-binding transcriptional MocR family regulator